MFVESLYDIFNKKSRLHKLKFKQEKQFSQSKTLLQIFPKDRKYFDLRICLYYKQYLMNKHLLFDIYDYLFIIKDFEWLKKILRNFKILDI